MVPNRPPSMSPSSKPYHGATGAGNPPGTVPVSLSALGPSRYPTMPPKMHTTSGPRSQSVRARKMAISTDLALGGLAALAWWRVVCCLCFSRSMFKNCSSVSEKPWLLTLSYGALTVPTSGVRTSLDGFAPAAYFADGLCSNSCDSTGDGKKRFLISFTAMR